MDNINLTCPICLGKIELVSDTINKEFDHLDLNDNNYKEITLEEHHIKEHQLSCVIRSPTIHESFDRLMNRQGC